MKIGNHARAPDVCISCLAHALAHTLRPRVRLPATIMTAARARKLASARDDLSTTRLVDFDSLFSRSLEGVCIVYGVNFKS